MRPGRREIAVCEVMYLTIAGEYVGRAPDEA